MKWLHTIGSIALLALGAFTPYIQGAISTHPAITAGLAAFYAILGQFVPHADPTNGLVKTGTQI